jgi:hypothetical protein
MFKRFLILFIFSLLEVSCSDGDDVKSVERSNNDYSPTTVGSTWTYYNPLVDYEYTISISSKTKTINGKTYFGIESGGDVQYVFRREGNNYIQRELVEGTYLNREFIYLKDEPINTKWIEYLYPDTENENVIELEVIERDGSYTVGENTFTNVIVVKSTNITSGDEEQYFALNYYAKGVGHIKAEDAEGNLLLELLSYSIK